MAVIEAQPGSIRKPARGAGGTGGVGGVRRLGLTFSYRCPGGGCHERRRERRIGAVVSLAEKAGQVRRGEDSGAKEVGNRRSDRAGDEDVGRNSRCPG